MSYFDGFAVDLSFLDDTGAEIASLYELDDLPHLGLAPGLQAGDRSQKFLALVGLSLDKRCLYCSNGNALQGGSWEMAG